MSAYRQNGSTFAFSMFISKRLPQCPQVGLWVPRRSCPTSKRADASDGGFSWTPNGRRRDVPKLPVQLGGERGAPDAGGSGLQHRQSCLAIEPDRGVGRNADQGRSNGPMSAVPLHKGSPQKATPPLLAVVHVVVLNGGVGGRSVAVDAV